MANSNQIELVVTVEVDKANQSIKSVNANLSSMEAAASKSARAASQGIDGMTASMVKGATAGTLFADAIKKAVEFAKNWTVEAAKAAAHESRMEASGRALAKAHGIASEAFERAVEAVRKVGYHGEEAVHTIDRLIVADLDLSKATGLAKIAKDAAAIENITPGEALEKILQAIEFGNARALRSAGLRVDFEKQIQTQEVLLGRTLSDNEKVQIRYNAVVKAAASIQGAAAGAAGEAEMQMKALGREAQELREAVGAQFQEQFKALVAGFRDLVSFLRDNADYLAKFGEVALWVAGILATYALAAKMMDLAKSVAALRLASLNPYALLATGVIAAGAIVYHEYNKMGEQREAGFQDQQRQRIRDLVGSGKSLKDLHAMGLSDDQIREALTRKKTLEPGDLGWTGTKLKLGSGPDPEALKRVAEIRKRQTEIERESRQAALQAGARGAPGFAKDIGEVNAQIAKWTTFTNDKGVESRIALTRDAWVNVIDQLERRFGAFKRNLTKENREHLATYLNDLKEANDRAIEFEAQSYQRRLQNDEEWASQALDHVRAVYAYEEQRAGYVRDAQIRTVEAGDAQTIAQKARAEQRKMEIEVEYLEKVHEIRMRLFDLDTSRQVLEMEGNLARLGYKADEIRARIAEYTERREDLRQQQEESTDAAIQAARENASNRTAQMIRDHNRSIFESLKQQAGGIFDALLSKSQSVWSAIGNSFKTAILTAIKEVVTSRVAAILMQLFTGQKVSFAQGGMGGGGALGRLGGLLGIGAVPVFGGGWTGPNQTPPGGMAFAPGGGQFSPLLYPTAAIPGVGGGGGSLASLSRLQSGAVLGGGLLAISGMQRGGASGNAMTIGGGAMAGYGMASTMGMTGYGGAITGAGAGLALAGLQRGGWSGLGMSTAGGAIVGMQFGGPLGAAIGAGVGFVAGLVRMFIKGAQEKVREKIKSLYGVDIADKAILKQIVDTAKQAFGGNLDVAIRSLQVREIVQLYAMSTGQPPRGMPAQMTPLSLAQSGGSLYQVPGYSNGAALSGLGGLPTLDSIGAGTASIAGPATVVNLQIDSQTVGNVVIRNGRVVAQGAINAMKANAGRRELTSLQMSPGLLTV